MDYLSYMSTVNHINKLNHVAYEYTAYEYEYNTKMRMCHQLWDLLLIMMIEIALLEYQNHFAFKVLSFVLVRSMKRRTSLPLDSPLLTFSWTGQICCYLGSILFRFRKRQLLLVIPKDFVIFMLKFIHSMLSCN